MPALQDAGRDGRQHRPAPRRRRSADVDSVQGDTPFVGSTIGRCATTRARSSPDPAQSSYETYEPLLRSSCPASSAPTGRAVPGRDDEPGRAALLGRRRRSSMSPAPRSPTGRISFGKSYNVDEIDCPGRRPELAPRARQRPPAPGPPERLTAATFSPWWPVSGEELCRASAGPDRPARQRRLRHRPAGPGRPLPAHRARRGAGLRAAQRRQPRAAPWPGATASSTRSSSATS